MRKSKLSNFKKLIKPYVLAYNSEKLLLKKVKHVHLH